MAEPELFDNYQTSKNVLGQLLKEHRALRSRGQDTSHITKKLRLASTMHKHFASRAGVTTGSRKRKAPETARIQDPRQEV